MGQIIFLNTNYQPREAEKIQFHYLQAATNNVINEILKSERDEIFAQYRISLLVQMRRSKMKLIKDEREI